MPTRADFYVGRGLTAEWVGSVVWDGYPDALPSKLAKAESEEVFRKEAMKFLKARGDAILPEHGWPWSWDDSSGTTYSYAFEKEQVWACAYGSSWWKVTNKEPNHRTLKRKTARFPDMSLRRKLASTGGSRRRIFVAGK